MRHCWILRLRINMISTVEGVARGEKIPTQSHHHILDWGGKGDAFALASIA
jgi:hypothetical protein